MDAKKCTFCEVEENETIKLKKCSKCKYTKYCSVKCQSSDWIIGHNNTCKKLTNPSFFKYFEFLKKDKITLINTEARKIYEDNIEHESQQVVLCEIINIDKNEYTFSIINQFGINNPPDLYTKKNINQCKDKFLLIIHDLESKMMTFYDSEKIKIN